MESSLYMQKFEEMIRRFQQMVMDLYGKNTEYQVYVHSEEGSDIEDLDSEINSPFHFDEQEEALIIPLTWRGEDLGKVLVLDSEDLGEDVRIRIQDLAQLMLEPYLIELIKERQFRAFHDSATRDLHRENSDEWPENVSSISGQSKKESRKTSIQSGVSGSKTQWTYTENKSEKVKTQTRIESDEEPIYVEGSISIPTREYRDSEHSHIKSQSKSFSFENDEIEESLEITEETISGPSAESFEIPDHARVLVYFKSQDRKRSFTSALDIYDTTGSWCLLNWNEIKTTVNSIDDLLSLGTATIFVPEVNELTEDQMALLALLLHLEGDDLPSLVFSSKFDLDALYKSGKVMDDEFEILKSHMIDLDRIPYKRKDLRELVDLLSLDAAIH